MDSTLRGRVEGATAGTVALYEEVAGRPRRLVGEYAVDAQGLFDASAPAPAVGAAYRIVYLDPTTGVPYARLVRP